MDSFWRDAWASFKAVFGPILTGAAFVLALLGPLYAPAAVAQVSLFWLAVSGLVAMAVLLAALNMVLTARRSASGRLPKTRYAHVGSEGATGPVTLVLDRSELFGFNVVVAIYYTERLEQNRDEMFERLIGVGRVANIQQNGLVQILVLLELLGNDEVWQRIRRREANTITQVMVKPSVPFDTTGIEVRFNE